MKTSFKLIFSFVFFVVCLLVSVQADTLQRFTSQDGTYSVEYPKGWYSFVLQEKLGGVHTYFFPQEVSVEQFRTEGVDVNASFMVLVERLRGTDKNLSRKELAEQLIKTTQKTYQSKQIDVIVESTSTKKINGKKWSVVSMRQPVDREAMIFYFYREGEFLYIVENHVKEKYRGQYRQNFNDLINSFEFHKAKPLKTKKFVSSEEDFSINLPKEWYYKEYKQGKADQYFVTRTELMNEESVFNVGLTVIRYKNAKKLFSSEDLTDQQFIGNYLIGFSKKIVEEGTNTLIHSFENVSAKRGGDIHVMELDVYSENTYYAHREILVTYMKGQDLYTCIFEAPIALFEKYRPSFEKAYSSLSI